MDTPHSSAHVSIPWWPGVVVAIVFLVLSIVLLVLFLKKPQAQPPSKMTCDTNSCPHGVCEEGICTYQCNDTTCPSENNLACGDDGTCKPQSPSRTDYCDVGTFDDYLTPGKCDGDGTCASDCKACQTASCSSTCTDPDGKGRIGWNEQTGKCELKDDWNSIDCPNDCSGTSSTKLYGIQCRPGFLNQDGTSDHIPPTGAKCYGSWDTFGGNGNAKTVCEGTSDKPTDWHFAWPDGKGPFMCGKN
jgi:hypothetical protein